MDPGSEAGMTQLLGCDGDTLNVIPVKTGIHAAVVPGGWPIE